MGDTDTTSSEPPPQDPPAADGHQQVPSSSSPSSAHASANLAVPSRLLVGWHRVTASALLHRFQQDQALILPGALRVSLVRCEIGSKVLTPQRSSRTQRLIGTSTMQQVIKSGRSMLLVHGPTKTSLSFLRSWCLSRTRQESKLHLALRTGPSRLTPTTARHWA